MQKIKKNTFHKWIIANAIGMTLALGLGFFTHSPLWLIGMAMLLFAALIFIHKKIFQELHPLGGYANWITFARLLIIVLTVIFYNQLADYQLFILFGLAVFLDGVDGWAAKSFGQESELGALFDKETDAFFVLVLIFLLVEKTKISAAFLAIGWLHYAYEIIIFSANWQEVKTPKNPVGRYIAVALFISLLVPLICPKWVYFPILFLASLFTLISFGISFWYKVVGSRQ